MHKLPQTFILTAPSYDSLKKYIYQLEKQQAGRDQLLSVDPESNERISLLSQDDASRTDALFIPLLDRELKRVIAFYEHQERELFEELKDLENDIELQDEVGLQGEETWGHYADEDDEEDDESISRSPEGARRPLSHQRKRSTSRRAAGTLLKKIYIILRAFTHVVILSVGPQTFPFPRRLSVASMEEDANRLDDNSAARPRSSSMAGTLGKLTTKLTNLRDSIATSPSVPDPTIWTSQSDYAYDIRLLYKRRITNIYITFTNLRSYIEINYAGFRKIIKKYDKVTYSELKERYLHEVVEEATPFTQSSKDKLNEAINRLTDLYTKCVSRGDKSVALQQLRLHQRENIAWERDTVWRQMIGRERRGEGDIRHPTGAVLLQPPEPGIVNIPTPVGKFKVTKKSIFKLFALLVFITLLNLSIVKEREANRCFAILTFCTILWATEVSQFVPKPVPRC